MIEMMQCGSCWGTTAATGRLLKRHRYTEAKEANGGMLDPNVAFYEESNCEKVKELVEAGMCVRCCLFIHDKDHDTRDPGLLDELLPLGLQYIATNDVSIILAAQSFKQDMRVKQDLQDLVKQELVTEVIRTQICRYVALTAMMSMAGNRVEPGGHTTKKCGLSVDVVMCA